MDQAPKKPAKDLQCRAWCITLWTMEDVNSLQKHEGIKAICIGKEICPTTGKEHYQGYIRFATNKRFSWWKKNYPTAHVEPRCGTEPEAADYCRKDREMIVDSGCQVEATGDDPCERALSMIESGSDMYSVYRDNRKWFFHNYHKLKAIREFLHQRKKIKYQSTEQEQSDQTTESGSRTQ